MAKALSVVERQTLDSVRFKNRDLPFRHKTMNKLLSAGLVSGQPIRLTSGRLSVNYTWAITETGIAAYEAHR